MKLKYQIVIKILLTLLIFGNTFTNSKHICNSLSNHLGRCIAVEECIILEEKNITPKQSLNDTFCKPPNICCEFNNDDKVDHCITPNNNRGVCVEKEECPILNNLLNSKLFSKIGIKYLTMSECKDLNTFLVCCSGKDPDFSVVFEDSKDDYPEVHQVDLLLPASEQCTVDIEDDLNFGIHHYPWMAQIGYKINQNSTDQCSAILITKRYLITTAHCVDEEAIVHLGEPINVRIGNLDDVHITIPIEEISIHPKYYPSDHLEMSSVKKNDIALIRIKDGTPFTDFIKPICLPKLDYTLYPFNNDLAVILQSNNSNIKNSVDVFVQNSVLCSKEIHKSNQNVTLWHRQLCGKLMIENEEKESFSIFSGNPLVIVNKNKHYLVGMINYPKRGLYSDMGIFIKIHPYIKWIRNTIRY